MLKEIIVPLYANTFYAVAPDVFPPDYLMWENFILQASLVKLLHISVLPQSTLVVKCLHKLQGLNLYHLSLLCRNSKLIETLITWIYTTAEGFGVFLHVRRDKKTPHCV